MMPMKLPSSIQQRLSQEQAIPFVDFMHLALYAPKEGYYSSGLAKLGAQGDFITAPELSPLFGKALANQCQQIMASIAQPNLFEFGAGSGRLCVDILKALEQNQSLPEHYYILEVSSDFRHRQQELINQEIPHLAARVQWLDSWPQTPFNGIILANEVLDAMPVHRFMYAHDAILESYISLNDQNQLIETFKPCSNQRLLDYIQNRLAIDTVPYISEVNLFIEDWIAHCYQMLNQGVVLLIDYGFPRHEYYHEDRAQGTLMCHYQHRAHSDFLHHVGSQDITAHVDFTQVAEAADHAGFHVAGYTNQASFLLSNGLLSLVEDLKDERERVRASQALKLLLQPSEMGELFKVIALSKNFDSDLNGFQMQDKRASL